MFGYLEKKRKRKGKKRKGKKRKGKERKGKERKEKKRKEKKRKEKKRKEKAKDYAVRCHDGSLCTQKQPDRLPVSVVQYKCYDTLHGVCQLLYSLWYSCSKHAVM